MSSETPNKSVEDKHTQSNSQSQSPYAVGDLDFKIVNNDPAVAGRMINEFLQHVSIRQEISTARELKYLSHQAAKQQIEEKAEKNAQE